MLFSLGDKRVFLRLGFLPLEFICDFYQIEAKSVGEKP